MARVAAMAGDVVLLPYPQLDHRMFSAPQWVVHHSCLVRILPTVEPRYKNILLQATAAVQSHPEAAGSASQVGCAVASCFYSAVLLQHLMH
jgi:hypothetical protein